jgi:hypothetical protein
MMRRALLSSVSLACLLLAAAPAIAQTCTLEYQRADNMWANAGRPDGPLGKETLTLQPGQKKVFITDWKYEKQRNDGQNYYGSHARIVTNTGKRPLDVDLKGDIQGFLSGVRGTLRQTGSDRAQGTLNPGVSWYIRADILEASCPSADKEAKADPKGGTTPGGTANPAAIEPPPNRVARQVSAREIVLTWDKVPAAREYRVYVQPPPLPHLAGRPGVVGASGTRFVILIPPNAPPGATYHASIETVGTNGAVSPRAGFNPVAVQRTPTSGGGTPQAGAGTQSTPAAGGQRCPPGEFVTGFDGAGKIICGRP